MGNPTGFADRELDIMAVLWRRGSGTVAEVRDALGDDAGYTTVLKQLQVLEGKGAVRHTQEGRAYRYFPVSEAEAAGDTGLQRLLDTVFQGSAELVLARLVEAAPPRPEELERMRALLEELAANEGPGQGDRAATGESPEASRDREDCR
jgi:predicted transcriptional regulator